MMSALDISTSALVAQRVRMDTVSSNLANMSSFTRNENGEMEPFQARYVMFQTDDQNTNAQGAAGVKVASIETEKVEPNYRWQPEHPYAIKEGPRKGYVAYPKINMMSEMVDAMVASRAYEANIGAMEITKSMATQSLRILG